VAGNSDTASEAIVKKIASILYHGGGGMTENGVSTVTVERIMKKIEEEIKKAEECQRRDDGRMPEHSGSGVKAADLLSSSPQRRKVVSAFFWKYGTRHAIAIKKIPGLNRIAEHFYWRLSGDPKPVSQTTVMPFAASEILARNLNFAGFLDHLKHEGLKGKIKLRIFTVIGFFAWWQGQVNSALYEKLSEQGTRLAEHDARLAEQSARLAEQDGVIRRLAAEAAARDRAVMDLERRLSVQSRLEDAIYEELTAQRAEIARQQGWSASE
jgi:hypothetical protein